MHALPQRSHARLRADEAPAPEVTVGSVEERSIGPGGIPIRYRLEAMGLPVVLSGGGWVIGDLETQFRLLRNPPRRPRDRGRRRLPSRAGTSLSSRARRLLRRYLLVAETPSTSA